MPITQEQKVALSKLATYLSQAYNLNIDISKLENHLPEDKGYLEWLKAYFPKYISDPDGNIRRQDKHFAALHVIVLDDVGSKASTNSIPPTYVIESSPGNYQWGYVLEEPITDLDEANRIMRSIAQHGNLTDRACNTANRVFRLPLGINGKGSPGELKHDHKVRLLS